MNPNNQPLPTNFVEQLNALFSRSTERITYTEEQLAELHLQSIGFLFHLEQSLPQEDQMRYYLNRLRWTLNIDPFNSALSHEVCLLLLQRVGHQSGAVALPS